MHINVLIQTLLRGKPFNLGNNLLFIGTSIGKFDKSKKYVTNQLTMLYQRK